MAACFFRISQVVVDTSDEKPRRFVKNDKIMFHFLSYEKTDELTVYSDFWTEKKKAKMYASNR